MLAVTVNEPLAESALQPRERSAGKLLLVSCSLECLLHSGKEADWNASLLNAKKAPAPRKPWTRGSASQYIMVK